MFQWVLCVMMMLIMMFIALSRLFFLLMERVYMPKIMHPAVLTLSLPKYAIWCCKVTDIILIVLYLAASSRKDYLVDLHKGLCLEKRILMSTVLSLVRSQLRK